MSVLNSLRTKGCLVASLVLFTSSGCGDGTPPIGKVTGTVTREGKPLPGVTVNFLPEAGRPSWGITDESGRYKLSWDADHDGAEVGRHKVTVAFDPGSPMEEAGYEVAGKSKAKAKAKPKSVQRPADWHLIEQKYGNFETTAMSKEVKSGSQVIDLQLD